MHVSEQYKIITRHFSNSEEFETLNTLNLIPELEVFLLLCITYWYLFAYIL